MQFWPTHHRLDSGHACGPSEITEVQKRKATSKRKSVETKEKTKKNRTTHIIWKSCDQTTSKEQQCDVQCDFVLRMTCADIPLKKLQI